MQLFRRSNRKALEGFTAEEEEHENSLEQEEVGGEEQPAVAVQEGDLTEAGETAAYDPALALPGTSGQTKSKSKRPVPSSSSSQSGSDVSKVSSKESKTGSEASRGSSVTDLNLDHVVDLSHLSKDDLVKIQNVTKAAHAESIGVAKNISKRGQERAARPQMTAKEKETAKAKAETKLGRGMRGKKTKRLPGFD